MKKILSTLAVVGAVASVQAVPTLRISDGLGNSVTIADNSAATIVGSGSAFSGGDLSGTAGFVAFSGVVGTWTINFDAGTSKPAVGSATSPRLDLSFNAGKIGGGAGVITIEFSDDFFGPLAANNAFVSTIGGTTDGSINYTTKLDAANALFAGAALTSYSFGSAATGTGAAFSNTSGGPGTGANPFSLTQVITITHYGSGDSQTTGNAHITVPDGGSMLTLLGVGLLSLGFINRSRK